MLLLLGLYLSQVWELAAGKPRSPQLEQPKNSRKDGKRGEEKRGERRNSRRSRNRSSNWRRRSRRRRLLSACVMRGCWQGKKYEKGRAGKAVQAAVKEGLLQGGGGCCLCSKYKCEKQDLPHIEVRRSVPLPQLPRCVLPTKYAREQSECLHMYACLSVCLCVCLSVYACVCACVSVC